MALKLIHRKNKHIMTLRILTVLFVGFGVLSTYAKRPNILFIIADDQSPFDFRAYDPTSPLTLPPSAVWRRKV